MDLWAVSDVGAVRKQNQDAYHISEPNAPVPFAVVCDGMGGAAAGNVASSMAVESFVSTLTEGLAMAAATVEQLLFQAVDRANELVRYRAWVDPDCQGMGTTLVAAAIEEELIRVINVGDSRGYLITKDGIHQITRDHSMVEDMVERGEITHEQARSHPKKNLITRALGAEEKVQADLYTVERRPGEMILLCSDGLSNVVSDQELLFELVHGGPPEEGCRRLLNLALSRGAPDNVTAVLIQV